MVHNAVSQALFEEQTRHLTGELLEERKWRVIERAFPVLDVLFDAEGRQPMRVRMTCDDWNDLPPSIALLAKDGTMLIQLPTGPTGVFNSSAHPVTRQPFVCMAGSREYHIHSSHTSDYWDNYRKKSGYDLGGIVTQIWHAWKKSTP